MEKREHALKSQVPGVLTKVHTTKQSWIMLWILLIHMLMGVDFPGEHLWQDSDTGKGQ